MAYPASATTFTTKVNGAGQTIDASHINDLQTEIAALEAAILTTGLAHSLKFVHNTYDIGVTAGTFAPRDLFLARNASIGGTLGVTGAVTVNGGGTLGGTWGGNPTLSGTVTIGTLVVSTGGTLSGTFGGNPILSGQVKFSDHIAIADAVSAPSTAAGYAAIYVDVADGDLKGKFGDGTVKTIVTDT